MCSEGEVWDYALLPTQEDIVISVRRWLRRVWFGAGKDTMAVVQIISLFCVLIALPAAREVIKGGTAFVYVAVYVVPALIGEVLWTDVRRLHKKRLPPREREKFLHDLPEFSLWVAGYNILILMGLVRVWWVEQRRWGRKG